MSHDISAGLPGDDSGARPSGRHAHRPADQDPRGGDAGLAGSHGLSSDPVVGSTEAAHGTGAELESRFNDPGLPAHVYRRTDTDEKAAKRAERQVSLLFLLSVVGTIIFVVGYFALPLEDGNLARLRDQNFVLGGGLALALFCIGAAAVHWAKKLMPDDELVEERHAIRSTDEEREAAVGILREGGEGTGFGRRKMIWGSMTAAMGALALPAIIPLRDLGPLPGNAPSRTAWRGGDRIVRDPEGTPIRAADIPIGGVMHVLPESLIGEDLTEEEQPEHLLAEKAKAAVILIRLEPDELTESPERAGWSHEGIVAYSKICTHVGCPVGLYEQTTHHLLCPCHQSTFDVQQHCKVVFGPADRALPQLAITTDEDGYLIAQDGFTEPVGPSFWERG
jgi:ubiquinol-cytochrome c reductase iron-sulfur subunit